ncbi:MAG: cytochrome c biogenesis protein CcdA [Pseudorhodoplanes sp.]|nr:cytochrome c biogenesis protein CcdA [Pseudorhodoplanes sp.]MCQ3943078.1 cytochrome c biogenesis protein CcdA [Alphaproteobacteria bacterium]GIK80440.1 MAG: cytochrome C biogenesis protein CcdA [Alphaproteobacteria bacterium]
MLEIGLFASFGAGLLSFLSPCILPLVPAYLCFLTGSSIETLTAGPPARLWTRTLPRACVFVIGFATVFVALGASASWLGRLVSEHLTLLSRISGGLIVLFGLHLSGVLRLPVLMREARADAATRPAGLLSAFVVGLAFGFGWTPCVGPVLASILLIAGTGDSVGEGVALLSAYAAGIGIPFLVAAAFTGAFVRWLSRFRHLIPAIEKVTGLALIATGIVIFFGLMPAVGNWLLDTFPILGRIG